jgi:protease-4
VARRGIALVLTFLGVAVVVSIAAFVFLWVTIGREPAVPTNAVLSIKLEGSLAEVSARDVVGYLRGGRAPALRTVVENLKKAKVDRRVGAVLLRMKGLDSPFWAKVQELRDAVIDFRRSGKPVYAYLEYGGDREYYLASAADKVFLMPSSPLELAGVATYQLFLKGTFDKVGVVPDLHHIGAFKTAPNTFTEKGYTAAHREMDMALNRDLLGQIVKGVADGRKKPEPEIRRLIDEGPFLPEDAARAGLIDDVAYEDQVAARLSEATHSDGRVIDSDDYARVSMSSLGLNRGPKVAVIYVVGAIAGGKSGFDPVNGAVVGSDTLIEYIRQARHDQGVRAIVLRIDSPGGSAAASDAIWRELMIARNERADRPIVASMSDLAASGGYYVAMPAHAIVAQPSTLTGSIGIFGGKFVMGGVYEKLGAKIESTSIGTNAEMASPARPYNASELRKVQEQLQSFYDQFVEKAAESRHTTPAVIDRLAQGRVWTGQQAKENGLVDVLGGLDAAVAIAKERAKLPAGEEVELVVYPPRRTLYDLVTDQLSGARDQASIAEALTTVFSKAEVETLRAVRGPAALFRRGEPLALLPFTLVR